MLDSLQRLDLETIQARLSTTRLGRAQDFKNELWDEIDSTNTRAAHLACMGAPEGVLVMARQQTAGRGRLGRTWVSPPDAGIYLSIILRPAKPLGELPMITLACGVAVVQALFEAAGVSAGLKWVNDLVVDGKKLGGILAEMPSSRGERKDGHLPPALIVGIGINVQIDENELPDELLGRIEWLEHLSAEPVDTNLVVSKIAQHLECIYDDMLAGKTSSVLDAWRKHSITLGQKIKAQSGNMHVEGTAIDITNSGALIVETKDRQRVELNAGEISIRTPDGKYC